MPTRPIRSALFAHFSVRSFLARLDSFAKHLKSSCWPISDGGAREKLEKHKSVALLQPPESKSCGPDRGRGSMKRLDPSSKRKLGIASHKGDESLARFYFDASDPGMCLRGRMLRRVRRA
jgi:hypothetical protein